MKLEITNALVVRGRGADSVSLGTTIPDPLDKDEFLSLTFKVAAGDGVEYVKQHFGCPVELHVWPEHKMKFGDMHRE